MFRILVQYLLKYLLQKHIFGIGLESRAGIKILFNIKVVSY